MLVDGHSHTIYKCGCGKLIAQCLCTTNDKEIVRFSSCHHRRKKKKLGDQEIPVLKS